MIILHFKVLQVKKSNKQEKSLNGITYTITVKI